MRLTVYPHVRLTDSYLIVCWQRVEKQHAANTA